MVMPHGHDGGSSGGTCENSQVSASKKWLILAALTCNFCPPNPRNSTVYTSLAPPPGPGTAEPQAQAQRPAATTKNQMRKLETIKFARNLDHESLERV